MTDAEYQFNIQQFRRRHWLHYAGQGLLMGATLLAVRSQLAGPAEEVPHLATGTNMLALLGAIPLVSLMLYVLSRAIRPNLRRPYAENMRLYQSRLVMRNSLLALLGLPVLAWYLLRPQPLTLVGYAALLLALAWLTVPTAKTYQRWLLS
ncbi:hypothetical protein HHL22_07030 [Hymenobacter sp. RP-2-7]|uniref:MFS transporter n=1 Tax=Hymenobacter polaris TaxID=2682546 RepID=A0A7Y0ACT3_9BACT|nr:hypothetical protein [Hymenobacter polaris]NML64956.1 hypothetical protein [Hymenobacter polaris]